MTSNKDISAVFKDFLLIFFPEKAQTQYFQKNNIVVPRKATKTTKTEKKWFFELEGRISTIDVGGRASGNTSIIWGLGGPNGMYLPAVSPY